MPPSTITPARHHPTETAAPQAPLSLEERLALVNTAMTLRLDQAAVAYEVNTAHIDTEPVDLANVITMPVDTAPRRCRPCTRRRSRRSCSAPTTAWSPEAGARASWSTRTEPAACSQPSRLKPAATAAWSTVPPPCSWTRFAARSATTSTPFPASTTPGRTAAPPAHGRPGRRPRRCPRPVIPPAPCHPEPFRPLRLVLAHPHVAVGEDRTGRPAAPPSPLLKERPTCRKRPG